MTWIVWLNFMLTLVNFRWWIRGRWLAVLNCIKAYTCSRRFVPLTHKFLLHPFVFLSLGLLRVKCYCCGSSKFSLCCKILISLSRKNLSLINAKLVNWLNTFVRCIPGLSTNPHSPSPLYKMTSGVLQKEKHEMVPDGLSPSLMITLESPGSSSWNTNLRLHKSSHPGVCCVWETILTL